jgi:micrococcal nuclease
VVDGDTLRLAGLGSSRLVGIDTPETDPGRPAGVECFGPQATAELRRLVRGARLRVRVELAEEPVDRFGRDLVYVWLPDGRFVNAHLVERGFARALTIAPNDRYAERFEALERRARRARLGRWGACRR